MSKQVAVLLVTHGDVGRMMVTAAEKIVGPIPDLRTVRVETGEAGEAVAARIDEAAHELNADEMLFLVDLYGSTPARMCCRSCDGHSVVLTGVNLAMLFKLATADRSNGAEPLAQLLAATGTKSIQVITS
ncbi:MAG TPA: hypothetical protein VH877_27795 [Polyangia bacterium]|nr:hypothetical protein [Polyangia bacterium]